MSGGEFWFRGIHGRGVSEYVDLRDMPPNLAEGLWAVVAEFDGPWHAWRIADAHECRGNFTDVIPITEAGGREPAVEHQIRAWRSLLNEQEYISGVKRIHSEIRNRRIEQVNLCRVLQTPVSEPPPAALAHGLIAAQHSAPYSGFFDFTAQEGASMWLVSASPEQAGQLRNGVLQVGPIKGTAATARELLAKDYAENKLVTYALAQHLREHLGGEPAVDLFEIEDHPTLVQLRSRVTLDLGDADPGAIHWQSVLNALLPPLSVFGVPRAAALGVIRELEPTPRGPYCGAHGWLDTRRGVAELGATIRSFWWRDGYLQFGTGAGITLESDPQHEWAETELKAARLLEIIDRSGVGRQ